MNRRKIASAITYCIAMGLAALLTASCTVYEHEEIEIRRCPQVRDTVEIPGWEVRE